VRVSDPALKVEINGLFIDPQPHNPGDSVLTFQLPSGIDLGDIHLVSRSAVVRETTANARRDLRKIGVGLARITIEDENGRRDIDLSAPELQGLNTPQDVHGVMMRWTDGNAIVPQALHRAQGQTTLELHVLRTYSYWEHTDKALKAA